MKSNYLLPYRFKKIGLILLFLGLFILLVFGLDHSFFEFKVFAIVDLQLFEGTNFFTFLKNNISDELISLLLIFGGLMVAFSKNVIEDEYISKIRLESLLWAVYLNYAVLIVSIIFIYNMAFFWILVINMFTLLLVFNIRFYWMIRKSKDIGNEE